MVNAALQDERGCLTARGLAALRSAPPGQGPTELAAHLVGCVRCQRRLLASAGELSPRSTRRRAPSMKRSLVLLGAGLLAALLAFALLAYLAG